MSQDTRQNPPRPSRNPKKHPNRGQDGCARQRARANTQPYQIWTWIKGLLQAIAADVSSMKTGPEILQSTVEKLGAIFPSEVETRISNLEVWRKFDTVKKQLQERGLSYSMLFPATLKVSVNNRSHTFTSLDTAVGFLAVKDWASAVTELYWVSVLNSEWPYRYVRMLLGVPYNGIRLE